MVHKTLARSYSGFQALGLPFTSLFCVTQAQQGQRARTGQGGEGDTDGDHHLSFNDSLRSCGMCLRTGAQDKQSSSQTVACARPHTTNVCGRMLVEMALLRFCSRGTDMKNR